MQPNNKQHCLHPGQASAALERAEVHGHEPSKAQDGPCRGAEPGGAGGGLLARRREVRDWALGVGRDAGARGGRRRGVGGVWGGVRGRGRRRRRGGHRLGHVHDELHAAAAVARDAADEVVLAGGLERHGRAAGAVAAERLAGGAGGVVRRAHLVHRVRTAGVLEL